jgi:hypothetical protein
MALRILHGDPFETTADALALPAVYGTGASHRGPGAMQLMQAQPAAYAAYRRQASRGRIQAGVPWIWAESRPRLILLPVQPTGSSPVRLRYLHAALSTLARDGGLQGIQRLALAPLGQDHDEITRIVTSLLDLPGLELELYEDDTA